MKSKKAVAVRYEEGLEAPVVVAKGSGKTAQKIIEVAQNNDILIKEDTTLVNVLDSVETGSYVPSEAWAALAVIYSFILDQEKN